MIKDFDKAMAVVEGTSKALEGRFSLTGENMTPNLPTITVGQVRRSEEELEGTVKYWKAYAEARRAGDSSIVSKDGWVGD